MGFTGELLLSKLERRLGRLHARNRDRSRGADFRSGDQFLSHRELVFNSFGHSHYAHAFGIVWTWPAECGEHPVRHNDVACKKLPSRFEGFTLLHISDLHVDMSEGAMRRLAELLPEMRYDVCVLTGDYRGPTFGPFDAALEGLAVLRSRLHDPIYGVLGNHDTIRMVPGLEEMGIRMLLNECERIGLGDQCIYLAGIDDAHYYPVDNIEKASEQIPQDGFAILLSHTPEVYRQAAHAGFDLLLSGHTHGGQICLPGSIPLTLSAALPRGMGSGA
jgi:uncharacterized protein